MQGRLLVEVSKIYIHIYLHLFSQHTQEYSQPENWVESHVTCYWSHSPKITIIAYSSPRAISKCICYSKHQTPGISLKKHLGTPIWMTWMTHLILLLLIFYSCCFLSCPAAALLLKRHDCSTVLSVLTHFANFVVVNNTSVLPTIYHLFITIYPIF